MREDNLLCLRKRKFVVTTDPDHGLPVYPNLVPPLKLTGSQVIWILPVPAESLNSDCRFY